MPPSPTADRQLFRPEAVKFRQQRHMGTIVLLRPLALRVLTVLPLAIAALLVLAASRLTVQQRFAGLALASDARNQVLVTVELGAASAIHVGDRVRIERPGRAPASPGAPAGTVAAMTANDCQSGAQATLVLGAGSQHQRCLALRIDLDAALPPHRASQLVELWAPARSYLRYLVDR